MNPPVSAAFFPFLVFKGKRKMFQGVVFDYECLWISRNRSDRTACCLEEMVWHGSLEAVQGAGHPRTSWRIKKSDSSTTVLYTWHTEQMTQAVHWAHSGFRVMKFLCLEEDSCHHSLPLHKVSLSLETFALLWGLFVRLWDMTLAWFQSSASE